MVKRKDFLIFYFLFFIFSIITFSNTDPFNDQDCLSCHGKPDISQIMKDGNVRSLFVDPVKWSQDIHHKGRMVCVDCHIYANPYTHFREGSIDVDCDRCHPEEAEEYQKNIHFDFTPVTPGKKLPLCYDCHTKHYINRQKSRVSSVSEKNIGATCGRCHAELLGEGILKGSSIGKISGHRKGDLAENFDMRDCIGCHYEDSAHGNKRVNKSYCPRCHNVREKPGFVMGSVHLNSKKWVWLNFTGSGLMAILLAGGFVVIGYRSRKIISKRIKAWFVNMKIEEKPTTKETKVDKNPD